MIPRRIVTAISADGKAVVQSDGHPPWAKEMVHTPGFVSSVVWATVPDPSIPAAKGDPTDAITTIVPPAGETRFLLVTFPPDSVYAQPGFDFATARGGNRPKSHPASSSYSNWTIPGCIQRRPSTMASCSTAKSGWNSTTARQCISRSTTWWYRTAPATPGGTRGRNRSPWPLS
jgi:hypothetical protein